MIDKARLAATKKQSRSTDVETCPSNASPPTGTWLVVGSSLLTRADNQNNQSLLTETCQASFVNHTFDRLTFFRCPRFTNLTRKFTVTNSMTVTIIVIIQNINQFIALYTKFEIRWHHVIGDTTICCFKPSYEGRQPKQSKSSYGDSNHPKSSYGDRSHTKSSCGDRDLPK
jgi:hypothetical protein